MIDGIALDPLSALRAATHERHAQLDSSDWFDRATANRPAYAEHLSRIEALYRHAEPAMFAFRDELSANGFEPERREKLPLIAAELARLGQRSDKLTVTQDDGRGFPVLRDISAVLGCAYVLEGSTLGGMVLAQRIRERLGWESSFYGVYGARTGAMWRAFMTALGAMQKRCDVASMTASAAAVYDAYALEVCTI